jgi:sugar lactone lactonase YvrE
VTEEALRRYELRATLGESPVWCARSQRLWFVDIRAPALYRLDVASGTMDRFATPDLVGMVAMATEGLVVAQGAALCRFDPDQGTVGPPFLRLDRDHPDNRINDTKAGPDGALWCGTMRDGGGEPIGSLYRIGGDGQVAMLMSGIAVPNALCFSPDGATVYFTDTRVGVILRADARADRPVFEPFAKADVAPGRPDGATVDSEGYLWSARYAGGCIARISPQGDLDRLIELPVTQPTACAFGGPDLRTLFITTARQRLSDADCALQPDAGDLFALTCDVAGLPEPRFALGRTS